MQTTVTNSGNKYRKTSDCNKVTKFAASVNGETGDDNIVEILF